MVQLFWFVLTLIMMEKTVNPHSTVGREDKMVLFTV